MGNWVSKTQLLTFLMVCFILFTAVSSFSQSNGGKKEQFYNHLKSLTPSDGKSEVQQTQEYLGSLGDRDFLDVMNGVAEDESSPGLRHLFVSHIKTRWGNKPPVKQIVLDVKTKEKNRYYRKDLIDYLTWALKRAAQCDGLEADLAVNNAKAVAKDFKHIVGDKRDNVVVRHSAISRMSALLGMLREANNLASQEVRDYGDFLIRTLMDDKDDEIVRSRAAKGLRILGDEKALPYLRDIIRDRESKNVMLTRSAVLALSKLKDRDSMNFIFQLLEETESQEVFRTAVYGLGLFHSAETISIVLRNKGRFDPNATRSLLRGYRETIERVFESNDHTFLIDAINLVNFVKWYEMKKYLPPHVTDSDPNVRKAAIETLFALGQKEDLEEVLKRTSLETEPSIVELLQQVEAKSKQTYLRPDKSMERTE